MPFAVPASSGSRLGMIVPDVLEAGLTLVFCGTAPSRASMTARAYYAHPGNLFWPTLFNVGLTPRLMAPAEYAELPRFGLGLTDLNKTEWGADSELSRDAFDVEGLKVKLRRHRPRALAFTSKTAAGAFLGRRVAAYGRQAEAFEGVALFALPSTSGRARGYFDPAPWREVAALVAETPPRD